MRHFTCILVALAKSRGRDSHFARDEYISAHVVRGIQQRLELESRFKKSVSVLSKLTFVS